MTTIVRGNIIDFATTFTGADSEVLTPASATLTVNFRSANGDRVDEDIEMDADSAGEVWTATWDSAVAKPGAVYWSAQASDPEAAVDGDFEISANPANPGP